MKLPSPPYNTILYGPPGTGKTYRSSALALRLIEGLSAEDFRRTYPTRTAIKERAEQYRREGRLATTIFHPSFAYEDFVEGIKPRSSEGGELRYEVEDGIFRQLCVRAAHALYRAQQQNTLTSESATRRNFDPLFLEFIDYLRRTMTDDTQEVVFESKTGKPFYLTDINQNNTLSLRMGQGHKAYAVTRRMLAQLYRRFAAADEIDNLRRDLPASVRGVGSVAWAVFNRLKHYEATRNQTYRHLLSGADTADAARYRAMKRDVRQLDYAHLKAKDYTAAGNFVLIIDEINRGNVAAIFGELIALLEDDKRAGQPEMLTTVLPYSRDTFSVPPNLYLIGTMNTADRSVETLDTALRRRFSFEAMLPDPSLLASVTLKLPRSAEETPTETELKVAAEATAAYGKTPTHTVDLAQLLRVINQRLTALRDADHQMGHGYLMAVSSADDPLRALRHVVYQKIIPLLREYFFGELEKVILVMGSGFFSVSGAPDQADNFFAEPAEDGWLDALATPKQYRVRRLTDTEFIQAVQRIYAY